MARATLPWQGTTTHESDEDDFYSMEELEQLKIRQWLTRQESSRTSDLGGTQNTSLKVDLSTVDPVAQGSNVTEVERHMSQPICYHEDSTQLKQDCNK